MINSEIFRINNFVKDENGNILRITAINKTEVSTKRDILKKIGGIYKLDKLSPIPMTENLLKSANLKFKELGFSDLSVSCGVVSKEIHFVVCNFYKKINYLHELQNLYLDFTNKELIFKEDW